MFDYNRLVSECGLDEFIDDVNDIIDLFDTESPVDVVRPKQLTSKLVIDVGGEKKWYYFGDLSYNGIDSLSSSFQRNFIFTYNDFNIINRVESTKIECNIKIYPHISNSKELSKDVVREWAFGLVLLIKRLEVSGIQVWGCCDSTLSGIKYIKDTSNPNYFDLVGKLNKLLENVDKVESNVNTSIDARYLIKMTRIIWISKDIDLDWYRLFRIN